MIGNAYAESTYNYESIKGDVMVSDVDITHLYENQYSIRIEIKNDLHDYSEDIFVKVFADNPNYDGSTLETYTTYALTNVSYIEDIIELKDSNMELFVIADPDNIIAETDEQNNMKQTEIKLHLDNEKNKGGHMLIGTLLKGNELFAHDNTIAFATSFSLHSALPKSLVKFGISYARKTFTTTGHHSFGLIGR